MSVYLMALPSFTWTRVNEVMMYHSCPHPVTIRIAHGGKEDSVVVMPYLSHGGEWMVRGAPGSRFTTSAFQVAPGTRIRTVAAQPLVEGEMDKLRLAAIGLAAASPKQVGDALRVAMDAADLHEAGLPNAGRFPGVEEGLCGDELVELSPPGYSDGDAPVVSKWRGWPTPREDV